MGAGLVFGTWANSGCLDIALWMASETVESQRARKEELRQIQRDNVRLNEIRQLRNEIRQLRIGNGNNQHLTQDHQNNLADVNRQYSNTNDDGSVIVFYGGNFRKWYDDNRDGAMQNAEVGNPIQGNLGYGRLLSQRHYCGFT